MNLMCEMAAPFVANSAVDGRVVARPFRMHTAKCLKCQARHAVMARNARALAAMREHHIAAPADLEWRVLSSLEGDLAVTRLSLKPLTWVAALASAAAAILIWRLKPRGA